MGKRQRCTKAVAYVRTSTGHQEISPEIQRERIDAYCKMTGLELAEVIVERGVSAKLKLAKRPAGAKIAALLEGGVCHVVALKLDRLFRNAIDALATTEQWSEAGISLHLVDMHGMAVDSGSSMGKMFLTMLAGFAEFERNIISERTSAALRHKRAHGQVFNDRGHNLLVINDGLRQELLTMRAEDMRVRQELLDSGELGGSYVPRMEAVHVRNAARLGQLITVHGWPAETLAGKDGAEAAWLIVQHAIGEPVFQREMLGLLHACADAKHIPLWHAAYLEDRIAMYEGRPQVYGTQWIDDPRDGRVRPWSIAEPDRVNELRRSVGLGPLRPIPEPGPELPVEEQRKILDNQHWWERWLTDKGWRRRS